MQREATPKETRRAILKSPEKIPVEFKSRTGGTWRYQVPRDVFIACMAWAARINEVVSVVSEKERRHEFRYGVYGSDYRIEEYEGEEFVIFTLNVLKRKVSTLKDIALPLKYEPYAKHLLNLFENIGDVPVFNFSRQYAWKAARIIFQGLLYDIQPYTRFYSGFVFEIDGHKKDAANHFLRHMRLTELGSPPFNFTGEELGKYVKWTASQYGVSPQVERYVRSSWHDYAKKLLIGRNI